MSSLPDRRVLVLINPRSGSGGSFRRLRNAIEKYWEVPGTQLYYQFSRSPEDGATKARYAIHDGVDIVLVAGGDGTVNSVGRALMETRACLGVIPTGSGNGFARHFGIPMDPRDAVQALAVSDVRRIDAGEVNGLPFFVTCSMAWDASIARAFSKAPLRGVGSYVFAGVETYLQYTPQPVEVTLDGGAPVSFEDPLIFTVANLTQFGGGAQIAPQARGDDGQLELVVARRHSLLRFAVNLGRLFDGTMRRSPDMMFRRFRRLVLRRLRPAFIQVDGEPVDAGSEITVSVRPGALRVLVPHIGSSRAER